MSYFEPKIGIAELGAEYPFRGLWVSRIFVGNADEGKIQFFYQIIYVFKFNQNLEFLPKSCKPCLLSCSLEHCPTKNQFLQYFRIPYICIFDQILS